MEELSIKLERNYTSARLIFPYKHAFVADRKVHLKRFIHYNLIQEDWAKKKVFCSSQQKTFPMTKKKSVKNERKRKLISMLKK